MIHKKWISQLKQAKLILEHRLKNHLAAFFILAGIMFVCALAGIIGRSLFFLAIFWPANAVLLGLLLRF